MCAPSSHWNLPSVPTVRQHGLTYLEFENRVQLFKSVRLRMRSTQFLHLEFRVLAHLAIGKVVRVQHLNLAQQCHHLYRRIPLMDGFPNCRPIFGLIFSRRT